MKKRLRFLFNLHAYGLQSKVVKGCQFRMSLQKMTDAGFAGPAERCAFSVRVKEQSGIPVLNKEITNHHSNSMKHFLFSILLMVLAIAPALPIKAQKTVVVSTPLSPEQMKFLAESGNPQAQCKLGGSYYYGENGFEQDYKKAFYWYNEAAKQNYTDAFCDLGNCYSNGQGVARDLEEAAFWYRKGAEAGHGNAQSNLGNCYLTGEGVAQNKEKAFYWFKKAADQNNVFGNFNLGYCYYYGSGTVRNYKKAVEYFRKVAREGIALAQYFLGECYYYGRGVERNYPEAVMWYRKAAEQNDADALYAVGYCYEHGNGVKKDYEESLKWYRKAAELGHEKAEQKVEDHEQFMFWFNGEN